MFLPRFQKTILEVRQCDPKRAVCERVSVKLKCNAVKPPEDWRIQEYEPSENTGRNKKNQLKRIYENYHFRQHQRDKTAQAF